MEAGRRKPVALFMAFGTKGDVHPIAAIAAAFCSDQIQYDVNFVTHSAHEKLMAHMLAKYIKCFQVSSPPVLPFYEENSGGQDLSFSMQKKIATIEHRQECVSIFETIFGDTPSTEGDFVVINFFALEGWSLAELFHVRCVVAAPYVVPYSVPSSFERSFRKELPLLYGYLKEAPAGKVSWKDVMHWMWPLFVENWGSWRNSDLHISTWPFTDPVTGLPMWHDRSSSPLLLYGFSKEVVECPGYWPSNIHVCGSWSLPLAWQFSCGKCGQNSALVPEILRTEIILCPDHAELHSFLSPSWSVRPIFVGLGSIASMGFLSNPQAFVQVLESVTKVTSYRFILFSDGYEPLDKAILKIACGESSILEHKHLSQNEISLFNGRIFCFLGSIPYDWLFLRCDAAVHHGGSGTTAAALRAGIPQVICPFILDQFYWAERMFWLGVSPEPLKRNHLLPDNGLELSISESASALLRVIKVALSPDIKAQALEVANRISREDGVYEAVKTLKEEIAKTTTFT